MNSASLNWLRAGTLGANDGIISISVLLVSVVGLLSTDRLFIVGLSGIVGAAFSMALGEYVSVSAQRDAEIAHNIKDKTNPYHAAISSFVSFVAGATIPFVVSLVSQNPIAIVISVIAALTLTTVISTRFGRSSFKRQLLRNVLGGAIALSIGIVLNLTFGTAF